MKRINDKIANIHKSQFNFFNRIKLADAERMKKMKDKSLSLFDKVSKELSQLDSFNYSLIFNTNYHKNMNNNEKNKIIFKKIKLSDKKFNRVNSQEFINKRKNLIFSLEKRNKDSITNKNEDSTSLSRNSTLFSKNFYNNIKAIKSIKSKRKNNDIRKIKSKIFNNLINNNISETSEILKSTNQSLSFNDNIINSNKNIKPLINLQKKQKQLINSDENLSSENLSKIVNQLIENS